MAQGQVARAIANLQWVHSTTEKLTQGWPADKVTYQATPTDNHVIWTMGHLASTYEWFRTLIEGGAPSIPESYGKLFGYGSKPTANAADYPSIDEVRAFFDRSYAALVAAGQKLSEADAMLPCIGDSHGLASDRLMAIDRAAWHDGWHSGQLGSLRKALGLPSVIG